MHTHSRFATTLADAGRRVPSDVAIASIDDVQEAAYSVPSLTTVRQASREMGRIAAEQLLLSIREPEAAGMVQVPYELVLRASTGPAPKRRR